MKRRRPTIDEIIGSIRKALPRGELPAVSRIARRKRDPFQVLVSTILSLRTKDEVTAEASRRLFALASRPEELAALPLGVIRDAIYPVGFYKTKARTVRDVARKLLAEYGGKVPDSIDELLAFKGVGRKTANLVITLGYGKDGICVDTHVHRVSNRLGLVATSDPEATEYALMKVLPRRHWIGYNELLVSFGKNVCKPISPHCSRCPLASFCPRIGVEKSR
jgi:endonuclease-3